MPLTNVKEGKRRWDAKAEEDKANGINAETWFKQVVYKDITKEGTPVVDVGK
ncbi:hypothetical protein [Bacillus amyloliquefaciens]|nr:hypothetical protein [Bacillus amyloliquefaciens]